MGTTLARFFSELATRVAKENGVSDVLYAALLSAPELYAIFAHKLGLPSTPPAKIVREYATGGARPDFLFTPVDGTPVLLEVKLFDRNYHYDEYSQLKIADTRPRLVLLSAHQPYVPLSGWTLLQWEDIIHEMEHSRDDFMRALATYFREVTMTERLERIALGRPQGILYLNRAFKRTIASYRSQRATCDLYNGGKNFGEEYSGYDYALTSVSNPDRRIYSWFGLVYYEGDEGISLWVEKRWCDFYDHVRQVLRKHYEDQLYEEQGSEGGCGIGMDAAQFETFLSCNDLNTQLHALTTLFTEFNGVIEQCL
jgi:hypothetical protein